VASELLPGRRHRSPRTSADNTDGMFGELLATSFARTAPFAIGNRCRLPGEYRRTMPPMNFFSGVVHRACIQSRSKATVGSVTTDSLRRRLGASRDVVIADDDGIVIVPKAQAASGRRLRAREDKEAATRKRLAAGELASTYTPCANPWPRAGLKYFADRADISRGLTV